MLLCVPKTYQFYCNFSNFSTTSACLLGYKCPYMFRVVVTFSCPSLSAINVGEKFKLISNEAWECRRSCILIFLTPDNSHAFFNALVTPILFIWNRRAPGSYPYKCLTYSCRCLIINGGSAIFRLLFAVFGVCMIVLPFTVAKLLFTDKMPFSVSISL